MTNIDELSKKSQQWTEKEFKQNFGNLDSTIVDKIVAQMRTKK